MPPTLANVLLNTLRRSGYSTFDEKHITDIHFVATTSPFVRRMIGFHVQRLREYTLHLRYNNTRLRETKLLAYIQSAWQPLLEEILTQFFLYDMCVVQFRAFPRAGNAGSPGDHPLLYPVVLPLHTVGLYYKPMPHKDEIDYKVYYASTRERSDTEVPNVFLLYRNFEPFYNNRLNSTVFTIFPNLIQYEYLLTRYANAMDQMVRPSAVVTTSESKKSGVDVVQSAILPQSAESLTGSLGVRPSDPSESYKRALAAQLDTYNQLHSAGRYGIDMAREYYATMRTQNAEEDCYINDHMNNPILSHTDFHKHKPLPAFVDNPPYFLGTNQAIASYPTPVVPSNLENVLMFHANVITSAFGFNVNFFFGNHGVGASSDRETSLETIESFFSPFVAYLEYTLAVLTLGVFTPKHLEERRRYGGLNKINLVTASMLGFKLQKKSNLGTDELFVLHERGLLTDAQLLEYVVSVCELTHTPADMQTCLAQITKKRKLEEQQDREAAAPASRKK